MVDAKKNLLLNKLVKVEFNRIKQNGDTSYYIGRFVGEDSDSIYIEPEKENMPAIRYMKANVISIRLWWTGDDDGDKRSY